MHNLFALIVCFSLFIHNLAAQHYSPLKFDTSSYWMVDVYLNPGYHPNLPLYCERTWQKYFYRSDTIINQQTYHHIQSRTCDYACNTSLANAFIRQDSAARLVLGLNFANNQVAEDTLLNFNLSVGDTIHSPCPGYTVDSIDLVMLGDSQLHRRFFLSPLLQSASFQNYELVEGVDIVAALEKLTFCPGNYSKQLGLFVSNNKVVYTNANSVSTPSTFCGFPLSLRDFNANEHTFTIYPNPFSNSFNIDVKEPSTLHLFNSIGNEVATFQLEAGNQHINIPADLSNGVYSAKLSGGSLQGNAMRLLKID